MIARRIFAATALLCALSAPAYAQKSKANLTTEINTNWPDNSVGSITPAILRSTVIDIINSYVDWLTCTGTGGVVYWNGGTPTCLAAGTNGQVLTQITGIPAWSNLASSLTAGAGITITGTLTPTIAITNTVSPTTVGAANAVPLITYNTQGEITATSILSPTVSVGNITGVLSNSIVGNNTGGTANALSLNGAQAGALLCAISRTVSISATNATFSTPTCNGALPARLELTMIGGGGGGGGGNNASASTAGNNTCWNTSGTACSTPVYQAGGGGSATNTSAGTGGTVSGSGTCDWSVPGGSGSNGTPSLSGSIAGTGGRGGDSSFGGGGGGINAASAGLAGATNSGGGGGGGGVSSAASANTGSGGGGGATCHATINAPAASYTYTVAATAGGAGAGTSGGAGGNGAAGMIIATSYWQ